MKHQSSLLWAWLPLLYLVPELLDDCTSCLGILSELMPCLLTSFTRCARYRISSRSGHHPPLETCTKLWITNVSSELLPWYPSYASQQVYLPKHLSSRYDCKAWGCTTLVLTLLRRLHLLMCSWQNNSMEVCVQNSLGIKPEVQWELICYTL